MKLYLIFVLVFGLLWLSFSEAFAQNIIQGKVVDNSKQPIPFANVYITQLTDTTKVITGTVTDLNGEYKLDVKTCKQPVYFVYVRCMGFKAIKDSLTVSQIPDNYAVNIDMEQDITALEEIKVEAKTVVHGVEKSVYSISPLERRQAISSLSLLTAVPTLKVDETSNSVTTHFDKSVKILLNGRNSTDKEIMALPQSQIVVIEHYKFPPARFADENYAEVVNVITKAEIEGGSISVDLLNSPISGYGDDQLFFSYNRKRTQISGRYYYSYRNQTEKISNQELTYNFNQQPYSDSYKSDKFPFGYNLHQGNITIVNQKDKNYMVSLDIKPGYTDAYNKPKYSFNEVANGVSFSGRGETESLMTTRNLTTDLYFKKTWGERGDVLINVVGNYFDSETNYHNLRQLTNGDTLLYDFLDNQNDKASLISEIQYSTTFSGLKLNSGYKSKLAKLNQNIENMSGQGLYVLKTADNYLYTELIGSYKKLSYRGSLGVTQSRFISDGLNSQYSFLVLVPRFDVNYAINKLNVKMQYELNTDNPSLSDLNTHLIYDRNHLATTGNPNLIPYKTHDVSLSTDYQINKIQTGVEVQYSYSNKPILRSYCETAEGLVYKPNNELSRQEYALLSYVKLKFFKDDKLKVSVNGALYSYANKYADIDVIRALGFYINTSITYNIKQFTLATSYANGLQTLSNQTIVKKANFSSLSLHYKYKNFTFGTGFMMPYSKSYKSEYQSVSASLVQEKSVVEIFDGSQIFYLRLKYYLPMGKSYKWEKSLNNKDTESGAIKAQ